MASSRLRGYSDPYYDQPAQPAAISGRIHNTAENVCHRRIGYSHYNLVMSIKIFKLLVFRVYWRHCMCSTVVSWRKVQ